MLSPRNIFSVRQELLGVRPLPGVTIMNPRCRVLFSPFAAAALSMVGCVATLDQAAAPAGHRELPDVYSSAPGLSAALVAARAPSTSSAQERWEVFFSDPNLQALITEALKRNQELGIRAQEIIVTRNEVAARRGEYLPKGGGVVALVSRKSASTRAMAPAMKTTACRSTCLTSASDSRRRGRSTSGTSSGKPPRPQTIVTSPVPRRSAS